MKITKYKVQKRNKEDIDESLIENIKKAVENKDTFAISEIFNNLRRNMKVGELKVLEKGSTMFFVYKEKQKAILFGDNVKCVFNGNACGIMDVRVNKIELCAASVMDYL